jgi:two-component system sensor histidine kinase TctE
MPLERSLLRTKLLTWLTVPLALLLTADTSVSYWIALDFSRRAYDHSLVEIAREVSLHVRAKGREVILDLPEAARAVLFTDPSDRIFHEITTIDDRLVAGERIPRQPAAAAIVPGKEVLYDGVLDGTPVRVVALPVQAQNAQEAAIAVVRIAETEVKRRVLAREILLSVVLPQILLVVIVGLVVWAGVVHGLAPLQKVQRAVAARSPYDRSPVATADVPAEVRPLLQAMNGLLERLDHVMTLQSRFIADAAHQLKTPVAALQAQLELAARESDPQRLRDSLMTLNAGLERLARLVSQLLALARNEPEAASAVSLKPVDLNAVAFAATGAWVAEALKKRIDLGFEGCPDQAWITADSERLQDLFDNLIDNALRYTPEGGQVTVRVTASPAPAVCISDDGPVIPLEERQRVFERFHRLLGSPGEGSGLGLAIAHEIVRIHGATIDLREDADGRGNMFTVVFPLTSRPAST